MCFTCARNIVFRHKMTFCIDVERMVCFPCVWLCFICVSFEFTLGKRVFTLESTLLSSTWWTPNGFESAHREHKLSLTHAITNLLGYGAAGLVGGSYKYIVSVTNAVLTHGALMKHVVSLEPAIIGSGNGLLHFDDCVCINGNILLMRSLRKKM